MSCGPPPHQQPPASLAPSSSLTRGPAPAVRSAVSLVLPAPGSHPYRYGLRPAVRSRAPTGVLASVPVRPRACSCSRAFRGQSCGSPRGRVRFRQSGTAEMDKTVVSSWNDLDPLEHVIVGRADFICIPPSEPATEAKIPEDSDICGMWGPRPLETVEKANAELDHLATLLEKRGVRVDRPTPILRGGAHRRPASSFGGVSAGIPHPDGMGALTVRAPGTARTVCAPGTARVVSRQSQGTRADDRVICTYHRIRSFRGEAPPFREGGGA